MSMFSKNLHRALSKLSIKQVDFAKVLGVPPTTVSGWIRGAHEPSIEMLISVCAYLNIPVGEMVEDKTCYVKVGDEVAELSCKLSEAEDNISILQGLLDDVNELIVKTYSKLEKMTEERDKYKERACTLEREVGAVKFYGDTSCSMVEMLKKDGASKITIEF